MKNINSILLVVLIVIVVLLMLGCSRPNATQDLLERQGYTEIETTGYKWFACSKDDGFSTGFKAKNPDGVVVTGVACTGLLKATTIRFN